MSSAARRCVGAASAVAGLCGARAGSARGGGETSRTAWRPGSLGRPSTEQWRLLSTSTLRSEVRNLCSALTLTPPPRGPRGGRVRGHGDWIF
eukprot:2931580-Prymnesium_polylepis.1